MASLDIIELSEKNTWNNIPGQKTTQGGEIFNNLTNNKAVASYSHAEGTGTTAYAIASHAEGEGKKLCDIKLTGDANSTTYKGTISNTQTNLKYIHIGNLVYYNNTYAKIIGVNDPEGIITVDKTLSTTAISNATAGLYSGATGQGSHVEGYISTASGNYSHAENYDTLASGSNSHAEGQETTASGENSHAEGYQAIAEGDYSHAEGKSSIASGIGSHAEGQTTTASGDSSHTEGEETEALGVASHAEGYWTHAVGENSHTEGYYTKAIGNYSHAEGYVKDTTSPENLEEIILTGVKNATTYTYNSIPTWTTIGDIIQNNNTYAKITAIDRVNSTITLDKTLSSLEALNNTKVFIIIQGIIAYGEASHAEGLFSQAIRNYSHAEGERSKAKGESSHSEGSDTLAYGTSSHAEGTRTTAYGNCSHAEGFDSLAIGAGSHAEGYNMNFPVSRIIITGDASATIYTLVSNSSIEEGETIVYYKNESSFTTAKVISVDSTNKTFTVDKTLSSTAITQREAFSLTSGALGNGSHIEGEGALASGINCHAEGESTIASKRSSHAEGRATQASGNYSHAEGYYTVAAGASSHAEGYYTIAAGERQHVQGQYNIEDTENIYSHIVGNGSSTTRSNAHTLDWSGNAWYAGNISAQGLTGDTTSTNYTHSVVVNSTTGQLEKVRPIDLNRKMASEAVGTDYGNLKLRGIKAGTADLTAGVSELANGTLYIVYE